MGESYPKLQIKKKSKNLEWSLLVIVIYKQAKGSTKTIRLLLLLSLSPSSSLRTTLEKHDTLDKWAMNNSAVK